MITERFLFPSPVGLLSVSLIEDRLYGVAPARPQQKKKTPADKISNNMTNTEYSARLSPTARKIYKALDDYFKGNLRDFRIPLVRRGTVFQNRLFRPLQNIPFGKTVTYGFLARRMGCPKGGRAIGRALSANPFLIVLPCHRVVGKRGLGGFALGLKAKKYLLSLEKLNIY